MLNQSNTTPGIFKHEWRIYFQSFLEQGENKTKREINRFS